MQKTKKIDYKKLTSAFMIETNALPTIRTLIKKLVVYKNKKIISEEELGKISHYILYYFCYRQSHVISLKQSKSYIGGMFLFKDLWGIKIEKTSWINNSAELNKCTKFNIKNKTSYEIKENFTKLAKYMFELIDQYWYSLKKAYPECKWYFDFFKKDPF